MTTTFKPGQQCPRSGQYAVYVQRIKGARFRRLTGAQVTSAKGEPFPPWSDSEGVRAVRYKLTDATLHRSRG